MLPWEADQVVKKRMVLQNQKDPCHVYKRLQYIPMCHISPRSNCIYSRRGNSLLLFSDHNLYAFLITLLQYPHLIFLYIALKKYIHTQYIYESRGKKLPVQELRWLVASSLQMYRYTTDDVALRHLSSSASVFPLSFCQCSIFVYIYLPSVLYSLEMDSITSKIKLK